MQHYHISNKKKKIALTIPTSNLVVAGNGLGNKRLQWAPGVKSIYHHQAPTIKKKKEKKS